MREIKFRGYSASAQKWLYGDLCRLEGLAYINDFEVDPDSVGQYTGLKDKNGVEIYEGDVVVSRIRHGHAEDQFTGVVTDHGGMWWVSSDNDRGHALGGDALSPELLEVIGNIYENQKLLETK